ncbi:MAG: pyruvate kinase [Balneolaceae bacterium]
MKVNPKKLEELISEIDLIISNIQKVEREHQNQINEVHPLFRKGAINLIHYRTLRTMDISNLQKKLGDLGLSMLGRIESHVVSSLVNSKFILESLIKDYSNKRIKKSISVKKSIKEQKKHSKDLFGFRSKGRRVRIMVTLPTEAAFNYKLVHNLIASGMNTARINCAHDSPKEWLMMINNLNKAKKKLNRNCKISMDLGGPKIRTGALKTGARIRKFKPKRNEFGQVIEPVKIEFVPELNPNNPNELKVDLKWLQELKKGDKINFTDTRDKHRKLIVKSVYDNKVIATSKKTSYIQTGTLLTVHSTLKKCIVGELPSVEKPIVLRKGDTLRILKEEISGEPAQYGIDGKLISNGFISCSSDEIFDYIKVGESIIFDDGKIVGSIKALLENEIQIEIIQAKVSGSKLRADKGINLPETNLKIKGLTKKDREDLKFVVEHADFVNYSFVNSADDVNDLLSEMKKLDSKESLGVLLKVETQTAYNNITNILLEGMKNYPLGVMVARGDLAIECGWENMARIQQEILNLCNAAYVPTVWATQVLENLAKKGVPSRSELTDAASGLKADCVMLNKGPFILSSVNLLDNILSSMNTYQDKNEKMFPAME